MVTISSNLPTPDPEYNAKNQYAEMMEFLEQAETKAIEKLRNRGMQGASKGSHATSIEQGPSLEFDGELAPDHVTDLDDIEDQRRRSRKKDKRQFRIQFGKRNNSIAGLTKIDEPDGTYVLVGGDVVKLCYDCNRRLPYYKGQCFQCRQEYQRLRFNHVRPLRRARLVELMGGQCQWCGEPWDPDSRWPNLVFSPKPEFKAETERLQDVLDFNEKEFLDSPRKLELLCPSCRGHKGYRSIEEKNNAIQKTRLMKLLEVDQERKQRQDPTRY